MFIAEKGARLLKANIYTSSRIDSIIQVCIGDYINEKRITEENSLYKIFTEAFNESVKIITVVKKEYKYIIPLNSVQYIQVIQDED